MFVEYRAACGRSIGICGYTAVPKTELVLLIILGQSLSRCTDKNALKTKTRSVAVPVCYQQLVADWSTGGQQMTSTTWTTERRTQRQNSTSSTPVSRLVLSSPTRRSQGRLCWRPNVSPTTAVIVNSQRSLQRSDSSPLFKNSHC